MIAKLVLLGVLQVTSYRAVPEQTSPECLNRWHCSTSVGDTPSEQGIAVSQDLLKSGVVHYKDVLYVEGYGYRIVNDTMNPRIHNAVDIFVYTRNSEKKIGTRHLKVYVIKQTVNMPGICQ